MLSLHNLFILVLIYTSTVAVSFYIQVLQTSATIIGATTGSVVAVHAGSLFVKAGRFWIDIVSGSILFKGSSNCHLLSLTPGATPGPTGNAAQIGAVEINIQETSQITTTEIESAKSLLFKDTLSPASTPIPSSSPSANSSSGNSIYDLSRKAKAIILAVIGIVFVLGTFLVIYLRKQRFIKQRRQIAAFRERLAQIPQEVCQDWEFNQPGAVSQVQRRLLVREVATWVCGRIVLPRKD
ncbi:hypothetical protein C8J55DRAFT_487515 [Lentinula edodes]|uniref:Uncharacterized protein n=1 Tax=Lentinula lateritia TaxID=40482 RepID=A0A9W9AMG0_9AGAR|nr:hypothetical protein C8J55DRAFT_487515 [Lentinula edodes]